MATIKQIDGKSIHQIQSGQVIVDLCSVVKELVENSVDAGASVIDVRFKNQGLDLIEVQDNGSGIAQANYPSVALKHHTSKLASYSDIASLQTFGFRGEALASLCALSILTVTTCTAEDAPRGSRLTFESSGKLKDTSVAAAQRGTTVSVESLFHNLPVRRRELDRNIKREWQKVIALLNQYACIQTNLKFSVSHQPTKGRRVLLFSTKGNPTTRENIINIFGAKTMTALVSLDLRLEMKPTTTAAQLPTVRLVGESSSASREIQVLGHVSRPIHGEGRQTPDRQMFFVNGRPCALPQFAKAFNEVYRSYNSSQSPFIFADIRLDTDLYDVNVSPDKRSILLHDQNHMLDNLRTSLTDLFDTHDYSVPISQLSRMTKAVSHEDDRTGKAAGPLLSQAHEESPDAPASDDLSDDDIPQPDVKAAGSRNGHKVQSKRPSVPSKRKLMGHGNHSLLAMFARQNEGAPQRVAASSASESEQDTSDSELESPGSHDSRRMSSPTQKIQTESSQDLPRPALPAVKSYRPFTSPSKGRFQVSSEKFPPSPPAIIHTPSATETRQSPAASSTEPKTDDQDASAGDASSQTRARNGQASEVLSSSPSRSRQEDLFDVMELDAEEGDGGEFDEHTQLVEALQGQEQQTRQTRLSRPSPEQAQSARTKDQSTSSAAEVEEVPRLAAEQSTPRVLSSPRRKDATAHIVQRLTISEQYVHALSRSRARQAPVRGRSGTGALRIEELDAADAESKLPLIIAKSDFAQMRIAGQFNLGFIVAVRPANAKNEEEMRSASGDGGGGGSGGQAKHDELFIIDQHASDEKFNFERLQTSTTIEAQRLVHPKRLQLTALEEEILLENASAIEANGFKVDVDTSGRWPVGSRCLLTALPVCRETTFDLQDLEELISLLGDHHSESSEVLRPSKVRKVLAMRACRGSVMIGKALTRHQMFGLVKHMGELDKPWNCPHGRPTMRHLTRLSAWDGVGWDADQGSCSVESWKSYVQQDS